MLKKSVETEADYGSELLNQTKYVFWTTNILIKSWKAYVWLFSSIPLMF